MAALALGAVGAGVGSFFGYASIGWSIGSALGNYLFAPDQPDIEGPRLTDRSVSGSAYGSMRPLLFGTYRMSGEIIWAADLKEHKKKEDTGSKGGGGGSYTTYTYSASFAMALCKGEIAGIRKIWMDSKLVYTAANDSSASELQVSAKIAKGIAVYIGNESQLPDPTIESYLGSGNTPAYRGTAYIVFTDLWVTDFGNRIPQITVEVVKNAVPAIEDDQLLVEYQGPGQLIGFGTGTYSTWVADDGAVWDMDSEYVRIKEYTLAGDLISEDVIGGWPVTGAPGYALVPYSFGKPQVSLLGEYRLWIGVEDFEGSSLFRMIYGCHYKGQTRAQRLGYLYFNGNSDNNLDEFIDASGWKPRRQIRIHGNNLYFFNRDNGELYHWSVSLGLSGEPLALNMYAEDTAVIHAASVDDNGFAVDDVSGDLYISTGTHIARYDTSLTLVEQKSHFETWYSITSIAFSNGNLWVNYANAMADSFLKIYNWDTGESIFTAPAIDAGWDMIASPTLAISQEDYGVLGGRRVKRYIAAVPRGTQSLSSVCEAICNEVGIEDADIDITDLAADVVRGYLISQQSPARGALEQLSAAYFFDCRESDGVLEFIKRGDTPTITLNDDDIGCYEGDDVQELANAVRIQEEELPKALTISYANVDRDYQPGAQYSIRQSVLNGTESTIQLPIAFTDDEAKSIVDKIMFSAWENRHKFTLKTWQAFHKLDPADVISARGETLRIISRNEGVNGLIEIECVRELPQIYTGQVGAGASAPDGGQSVYIGGETISQLLDIPPLRDSDAFDYGFYWAADGQFDDWSGAALLRSVDGNTFSIMQTTDNDAITGYCSTTLGGCDNPNIFDEGNVLRVKVGGVIETKTRYEVLNGGNVALVGDEIIQFRNATLVSTGVYDLSGLLRGRMGTDWAMSSHAENDRFVLLNNSALRHISIESSDLNVPRLYASITSGYTLEDARYDSLTYTANNLKPLTPVHICGGTTGAGTNWEIKWKRQSRYRWKWTDFVDVGADETSYDFDVRIHDNAGTVIRTINLVGATATNGCFATTYSNANQVTDFGEHQKQIYVSLRQVGYNRNSEWSEIETLYSGVPMTVLLLNMQGASGSTTFTDVYGHTVTANGNAQVSTAITAAGDLLLDGSGDYLSVSYSSDWAFSTQDFEIELNVNFISTASGTYIIGKSDTSNGWTLHYTGGSLIFSIGAVSIVVSEAISFTTGADYYISISRESGFVRMFINGQLVDSSMNTTSVPWTASMTMVIGATYTGFYNGFLNGHVKWLRITKGRALHATDYEPPTTPHEN